MPCIARNDGAISRENLHVDASAPITIDETSIRYDGWRIVAVCFLVATCGWGFGF
jgi:hypothetical protein